ncbi:MAG: ABC transporter ATP-binding protein [Acidimicrobiia bacterium]|nr:ABC transporter ATP-binding protein [Acidimicrobiia bacterium]
MSTLLHAEDVVKRFGDVTAVDGVSLDVATGEVVGLLGANGAGKTTFIRMLLGLLPPTAGTIRFRGEPVTAASRSHLGYVPQGLGLYPDLTVAENLAFAAAAHGVPLPELDPELASVADRTVADIPLGLRRRTAFAAAGLHEPDLLVLDEPTSGVGPLGRAALWDTVHEAAERGTGVLVSTHSMEEAEETDRVVVLAAGRVVAAGPVDDIVGELRATRLPATVPPRTLDRLRARGATVLADGASWRVVGLALEEIRVLVDEPVDDVPATFEEAFVELAR